MAQTWTLDAASGTYKNQALSRELYEGAFSDSRFMAWTTPVPGFGKNQGETVDLYTITGPSEPSSAALTESVRIPVDTVTISQAQLTVGEYGRAVEFTNKYVDLSSYQLQPVIQKRLREQLRLTMDAQAAAEFKNTYLNYIPTGVAAATLDTDGTPSTAATANLNLWHVQTIRDYMYGTYKVPFADGNNYVAICAWTALRGLKNDPSWQQWKVYGQPEALASGEIGTIESCRFIETNHTNALSSGVGTGSVLGECVFLGDEGVAFAEAVTPELRMRPKDEDYGRSLGVAWYGIYGFKLYHPNANAGEARVICVTSS